VDLNAITVHRAIVGYVAVAGTIRAGCKYMHVMPQFRQSLTKGMDGIDGSAIPNGGIVSGNNV
jgi:hypothetical protein